jgi:Zn-dependent protease
MNDTFKLGRIAGIPIGLNWTWLLVFALFVWSLASAVFPSTNPGLATATSLEMGIAAVVLFFGSLLLHELGHAVQARRDGVEIEGITLWLFGGVARFRGMFPSAGAEFRIAIAGPLVTAALAGAFVLLAALTHFHPAVDAVFAWLGYINLLLLAFNLLPALPLDGGRIFRAALWRIRGDFASATRIAAGLGRLIGGLLIVAGIITFVEQGTFGGVWLALIGWFVLGAAGSEARLVALRSALDGLVVADLMQLPTPAQADQTLRDLMAKTWYDDSVAYPVVDRLRPVGILPSRRGADAERRVEHRARAGPDAATRTGSGREGG